MFYGRYWAMEDGLLWPKMLTSVRVLKKSSETSNFKKMKLVD